MTELKISIDPYENRSTCEDVRRTLMSAYRKAGSLAERFSSNSGINMYQCSVAHLKIQAPSVNRRRTFMLNLGPCRILQLEVSTTSLTGFPAQRGFREEPLTSKTSKSCYLSKHLLFSGVKSHSGPNCFHFISYPLQPVHSDSRSTRFSSV